MRKVVTAIAAVGLLCGAALVVPGVASVTLSVSPRPRSTSWGGFARPPFDPKLAFQAFRFPFVTERVSRKRVRAWGRSPKAGKVKIEGKKGGKWRTLERIRVREDDVFTAGVRGSKQMRAQIGGEKSLVW